MNCYKQLENGLLEATISLLFSIFYPICFKNHLILFKRAQGALFLIAVMSFAYLISLLFPLCMSVCLSVFVCVCLSVCLYPRRGVISQPIFKYDISTDAYSKPEGVSENQFKIKPDVEKLFRKNLITHGLHHVLAQKCKY